MAKIKMFWGNCIKCEKKLKTAKEKKSGYCKICLLKQKLLELGGM